MAKSLNIFQAFRVGIQNTDPPPPPSPPQVGCFGCCAFFCQLQGCRVAAHSGGGGRRLRVRAWLWAGCWPSLCVPGTLPQRRGLQGPGGRLHSQLGTSLWARASVAGWRRGTVPPAFRASRQGAFSEPVTSLLERTQRGVCRPGFCVTKAFQRVRSMAFSVAEAWQGECGPWPVPASRLLLRPAAWLWAWTDECF